jgi:gas vesicle protein
LRGWLIARVSAFLRGEGEMNRLLIGAITGLFAGFLFAPQSGKRTWEMFKERFSFLRGTSMGRESMTEGWTGGTNDGTTEKSLEGTVRQDYLH